ncbi:MAG: AI-2E family transporter [Nibricoccus sp.]
MPAEKTDSEPLLNPGQRRLLGFSISFFCLVVSITLIVLIAIVLGRLIGFFSNVLWPLAVAGIMALILRPVVDRLEHKFRGRRLAAVIVLFSAFILVVTGLSVAFVPKFTGQILDFFTNFPSTWERVVAYAKVNYPAWNATVERLLDQPVIASIVESLREQAGKVPAAMLPSLKAVGGGFFALLSFVTHGIVIPIYLFFFLLSKAEPTHKLPDTLSFLPDNVRNDIVFLVREFIGIVVSFFRGQLVIGLIMGALLALGFSIVGLQYGLVLGLILGVLNIVPYLGTVVGLILTVPLAFLQPEGGIKLVALVLGVYVIVQNIEGWFLTPKIMGDRTGLHPVVIILAIFFWGTALDGILGMVLAIPFTAFFVTAWLLLKKPISRRSRARPFPLHAHASAG